MNIIKKINFLENSYNLVENYRNFGIINKDELSEEEYLWQRKKIVVKLL